MKIKLSENEINLRDNFAGLAMQIFLTTAFADMESAEESILKTGNFSYIIADLMMEARNE